MRTTVGLALWIVLAVSPAVAGAQAAPDLIELGEDAAVRRIVRPCWYTVAATCSWWQPEGALSFGGIRDLEVASAFARAPGGRILAMVPGLAQGYAAPADVGYAVTATVLYTDDLGATWQRGDWPDAHAHARAFAFDPSTRAAVAVGDAGSIWTSDDGGERWRRRRSSSGTVYVRAWVRGRTVIVEDDRGALWLSRDGGFALESLADGGRVEVADDGALVIAARDGTWRVDPQGGISRTR
ncbi:MAG: hypothetical protein M3Y87_34240 [Myxococcota bacterium]|nr:hypothetical protein [Myxococcota bacterium]